MSLWLHPGKQKTVVLRDYAAYPHFLEALDVLSVDPATGLHVPAVDLDTPLKVKWGPYTDFLRRCGPYDDVNWEWVDHVHMLMVEGADIPPLIRWRVGNKSEIFDGRHRACAARRLDIKSAPYVVIGS